MNVLKLDLNLLRIFHQMMVDRKVSCAAEALGVTQPAVSNALKRLRDLTGDELFTRSSRGMQPTAFAAEIAEPVGYALATIDSTFNQTASFNPATARHTFNLGLTEMGEVYLLPNLMAETAKSAPGICFNTVRKTAAMTLREAMENGTIDLAVDLLPQLEGGGYFHRRFLQQSYVICMRATHPLARKKLWTLDDYLRQEHIVVVSSETGHGAMETLMTRKGIVRNVRLTVPNYMTAGPVLRSTNMITTLPEAAALLLEQPFGLISLPHPASLPTVKIDACWHRRVHRDPANLWLRKMLFELYSR